MKISMISKVAVSAMALLTLSACAKGGGTDNNRNRNRNGYYNNGVNRNANGYFNNGQIGQQPILGQQQGQFPVGSAYPQPVKRVRIDKEEDTTYTRVSADDVDVLDGTIIDESSGCTTKCRPRHRHNENCRHDQDSVGTSQPAPIPQPTPGKWTPPTPRPIARTETPQPQAELPLPQQNVQTPARPPQVQPEQPIAAPVASGPIEIIYKDQLDSRQVTKANLSQTAYKAMIDELWRRLDLQLGYASMPLYEAAPSRLSPTGTPANTGYLASYKPNEQYTYVLSELALKLIETGACDFEETRGCVVVEKLPNGSVIGYHMAVADQVFIPTKPSFNGRLPNAVLRRDIINEPRLAAEFRKLKLIDTARIVVYSQKNSGSAPVPAAATAAVNTPVDLSPRPQATAGAASADNAWDASK